MQYGLCGSFDQLQIAKEAGYDYIEVAVASVAAMSDDEFEQKRLLTEQAGMPVSCCNVLFPGSIRLYDPQVTDDMIRDYLEAAFSRLERLHTETVVFGSGGARRRPEEVSYVDAFRRLVQVCRMVGDAAERHGITIVVEPLCRRECNMINSLAEGAALVAAADHPHVKLLADTFHITRDGEPMEDISRVGGVSHVHVALKESRLWPIVVEPELVSCVEQLKQTGYTGRISVEGRSDDQAADAPRALRVLKTLWEQ